MHLGKFSKEDLDKFVKAINSSRRAINFTVAMDGPVLKLGFEDDIGRICVVSIFDESTKTRPIITKTEQL